MKNNVTKSKLLTAAAIVTLIVCTASCKKNDINPDGYMNIKVVNAAAGSGPQSFTLAGQVIVSGGLDFTDASAYINTHSGNDLVAQFTSVGTGSVTATGAIWAANGQSWTMYLAGSGSSARVKSYQDDLSSPPGGMVKIKFIHLSDAIPSDIKVKDSTGSNVFSSIVSRDVVTGYKNINPGNFMLKIYDVVSGNAIGEFSVSGLQAGKIYTLYLTGSTSSTLSLQTVQHN